MTDPVEALTALTRMHERRLITDEEFASKRAEILERLAPTARVAAPAPAPQQPRGPDDPAPRIRETVGAPLPDPGPQRPKPTSRGAQILAAIIVLIVAAAVLNKPSALPSPTTAPGSPVQTVAIAPTVAIRPTSVLGARDGAVAYFQSAGFAGGENTLNDGRPRWLGQRASDSASVEAIGPLEGLSGVSMTIPWQDSRTNEVAAELGDFVDRFAPRGGRDFLADAFLDYDGVTDIDRQSSSLGGVRVRLQTLTATDGAIFVVSIDLA